MNPLTSDSRLSLSLRTMKVTILGIVDHTVYVAPFYAGDGAHELTASKSELADFIREGAKVYPSYEHIESILHGMSHEEYVQYANMHVDRQSQADDNSLPF